MLKLLLATTNLGKLDELRALLSNLAVNPLSPLDLRLDLAVEESGRDYAENAALKACAFAAASGLLALADDSGLEVDALNGAPGLHSARFAPHPGATDGDRRTLLLQTLAGKPQPWKAVFRSTICLALPNGELHFAAGVCRGQISPVDRGTGGFGYDRVFIVEGMGLTMAELSMTEKNELSHRAKALKEMIPLLRALAER